MKVMPTFDTVIIKMVGQNGVPCFGKPFCTPFCPTAHCETKPHGVTLPSKQIPVNMFD